jgi:hypothetical protein
LFDVNEELAENEEGVDLTAEDFVDKVWLLAIRRPDNRLRN